MVDNVLLPKTIEYTFFLALHGTITNIDHIISNKININRYKKFEIIPCILSDNHLKIFNPEMFFSKGKMETVNGTDTEEKVI